LNAADAVGQDGIPTHIGEQLLAVDSQRLTLRLWIEKNHKDN
jgi:hypothetical protein